MDPFLRPIPHAWLATGPVGAPNYDEFADCAEVRALAAQRPGTILPVDLPSCFTDVDFVASLPFAAASLQAMKDDGRYAPASDVLLRYDLTAPDGAVTRAVVGLVDTAEISSAPGEPGRLLRNEEVFADKVVERRAHLAALRHLISAVLLVPAEGAAYARALDETAVDGPADVTDTDERGVVHRLWRLPDHAGLTTVLDGLTYLVADGNHRSLAAQQAGLGACLVVIAEPAGLRIEPYHRLLRHDRTPAELAARALEAGFQLTPVDAYDPTRDHLYADRLYLLGLPEPGGPGPVELLPHTIVERRLLVGELGVDPAAVTYVGGDGVAAELIAEVDAGRATAAILLRPVSTAEFTAVNAARLPMPRKSTWFTPKARSGLVLAEL